MEAVSLGTTSTATARLFFQRAPGQGRRAARALQRGDVAFTEEGVTHYGYGLWALNA